MAARSLFKYVNTNVLLSQMRCATSVAPTGLSAFEMQHRTPTIKKTMPIPKAHYGGRHTVTLLPGAGIGPELMGYVKEAIIIYVFVNLFPLTGI